MDELDQKISLTIRSTSNNADRSWITPEVRKQIIERLLIRLEHEKKEYDTYGVEIAMKYLVSIGHEETIKSLIDWSVKNQQAPGFYGAENEESLALIMEAMLTASPVARPRKPEDERTPIAPRKGMALNVIDILEYRKVFPKETREWAQKMRFSIISQEDGGYYEYLKEWWKHNKEAIIAKRYADADWVPRYEGQLAYPGIRKRTGELKIIAEQEAAKAAAFEESQPANLDAEPLANKRDLWIYVSTGLATLIGLVWLIRSRRSA